MRHPTIPLSFPCGPAVVFVALFEAEAIVCHGHELVVAVLPSASLAAPVCPLAHVHLPGARPLLFMLAPQPPATVLPARLCCPAVVVALLVARLHLAACRRASSLMAGPDSVTMLMPL